MKNINRVLAIACSLLIGFGVFGCNDDSTPTSSSGPPGISFKIYSGNNQYCDPGGVLANRMVVEYLEDGKPIHNKRINFKRIIGSGYTVAKVNGIEEINTITDFLGQASVNYQALGSAASGGLATVRATVIDNDTIPTLTFTITIR